MKQFLTLIAAALLCCGLMNPIAIKAAKIPEVTAQYTSNREEAQKKNEAMHQRWEALSDKQKADIYKSLKGTLDAQAKFLNKLVKYELITQEDAQAIKDDMYARFEDMKANNILFPGNGSSEQQRNNAQETEQNRGNNSNAAPSSGN